MAAPPEVLESWEDTVDEVIDASMAAPPKALDHQSSNVPAATGLPVREATAPVGPAANEAARAREETVPAVKEKPAIDKRHWGTIRWSRGSMGWVTSDSVRTDRTVNPQNPQNPLTEITNAIFIHKNDCLGFFPRQGMDVNFRVEPDTRGKLKCADVRQQEERQMLTLDEWKDIKNDPKKVAASVSTSMVKPIDSNTTASSKQALNIGVSKLASNASSDKFAEIGKKKDAERDMVRDKALLQSKLSPSKLKIHIQKSGQSRLNASSLEVHNQKSDCASSTEAGLTSCSASVTSSRPSARVSRTEVCVPRVCRYEEIEQPEPEKAAPHQPEVAESWEDHVDCWDEPPLAGSWADMAVSWGQIIPQIGAQICKKTTHPSRKQLVNRKLLKRMVDVDAVDVNSPASEPKAAVSHSSSRERLVNRKLVERTLDEDTTVSELEPAVHEEFAQFCQNMGPEFPFEFVARHLGTDFEAIIQRASDVRSLDSLVRGGMKPLRRNKFCMALRQEKERRAKQGETPHSDFAAFLFKIGPEFDHVIHAFLVRNFGTDALNEIITRFTDLADFDLLVVAGMKPLFKNKLYKHLAVERNRRATMC